MSDLEGRALDEALVHALGWATWRETGAVTDAERRTLYWGIPEWHASLDALLRDIEPVCRERGMRRIALEQVGADEWVATILVVLSTGHLQRVFGNGPTAATALARAFLAVLTRGEM